VQGFPPKWTEPAWPLLGVGVGQHRDASSSAADVDKGFAARFRLIGNAVTVPVLLLSSYLPDFQMNRLRSLQLARPLV
jgi:hypothetical protein